MIVCAGQALIDCIVTEDGSKDVADDIALSSGGEALNEALVFSALGEQVYLSAALGSDAAGRFIANEAKAAGVNVLSSNYSGRTPVSLLTVDASGNRKSRVSKVHALSGYVPELPSVTDRPDRIDYLTMGSLFRPPFFEPKAVLAFVKEAKQRGAVVLADTKMPKGADPKLQDYSEVLPLLDFITPNQQEAEHYTGCSDPVQAAGVFRSYGVKNVIIKLDKDGCYVLPENGDAFFLPAYEVEVVDGIGAGDTFAAGLVFALSKGRELRAAAEFATACAAISVTGRGAASALRSEQQVLDFMAAHSNE